MNARTEITRLQDAKALKEIGAALNTPVIHREFSREFSRHWRSLVHAQVRFLNAVFKYAGRQNASVYKRQQVGRRLDDITNAIRRSDAFVGRLGDANRSDQDRHEQDVLTSFLLQRAVPFVEFWQKAIEALDNGVSLEIKPKDIPVWFDEVPA
jgi:hypothetical protein